MDRKLEWKAEAKIPKAADASKHTPGGGNVEIFHEKLTFNERANLKSSPFASPKNRSTQNSRRNSGTEETLPQVVETKSADD